MMNNPTRTNVKKSNGKMEAYDGRPISMYDNLNNMTTNVNTITTMSSSKLKMTKAPEMVDTNTSITVTTALPTLTKPNGAAHSAPFAETTINYNENNNIPQQKEQLMKINGDRNLSEITPDTSNAAAYVTPYKTSVMKPEINTASSPLTAQQQQQRLHSPSMELTTPETNTLTTPQSLLHPNATVGTTTPEITAAMNSNVFNSFNRPLSQHSQSELNDTSHSIAAVKAALNEAKSKFFGLNDDTSAYQDLQHNYEDHYGEETLNYKLLPSDIQKHRPQITNTHQTEHQLVQNPQPKYQNIPENSAIFWKHISDAPAKPPDLPPKPAEYQNIPSRNTRTTTPDHNNKMSIGTNSYNQISLNDIDIATSKSQTVYMATTVPQNIKGNKIAGRHTPTRSSLRHSRMLVVNNKNYEEVQHPNPIGFQQPNLARCLLILQIIIGILLLSLSIWIFFLTPNTSVQDNPYWCGLVLLIAGVVGLIVIRYNRFKRAKTREHCYMFLRMDSYVLSLLSVVLCCVALIFAAIHYCRLTAEDTKCKSMHLLVEHGSCICTFNIPPKENTTDSLVNESSFDEDKTYDIKKSSYSVEYRDLSCQEVTGAWILILGLSFILNSLGFIISLVYIVLLAFCRRSSHRLYTTVRKCTF